MSICCAPSSTGLCGLRFLPDETEKARLRSLVGTGERLIGQELRPLDPSITIELSGEGTFSDRTESRVRNLCFNFGKFSVQLGGPRLEDGIIKWHVVSPAFIGDLTCQLAEILVGERPFPAFYVSWAGLTDQEVLSDESFSRLSRFGETQQLGLAVRFLEVLPAGFANPSMAWRVDLANPSGR